MERLGTESPLSIASSHSTLPNDSARAMASAKAETSALSSPPRRPATPVFPSSPDNHNTGRSPGPDMQMSPVNYRLSAATWDEQRPALPVDSSHPTPQERSSSSHSRRKSNTPPEGFEPMPIQVPDLLPLPNSLQAARFTRTMSYPRNAAPSNSNSRQSGASMPRQACGRHCDISFTQRISSYSHSSTESISDLSSRKGKAREPHQSNLRHSESLPSFKDRFKLLAKLPNIISRGVSATNAGENTSVQRLKSVKLWWDLLASKVQLEVRLFPVFCSLVKAKASHIDRSVMR
jgi:hypothetical protein